MHTEASPPHWTTSSPEQAARELSPGETHLWLLSLNDPALPAAQLAALLGSDEQQRAARFHFAADRHRFEASHGLLRWLLGAYAGIDPAALRFGAAAGGKPALAAPMPTPPLEFNLSHSGDWALIGIGLGAPIGVDIEVERDLPELLGIARANFAPGEVEELLRLPPADRRAAFFAGWTRKEACVKAIGAGLSMPLAAFEVSFDPARPARLRSVAGSASAAALWKLIGMQPQPGVWVAAAVKTNTLRWHFFRA
jgi:4'-phosphopantetheinyl transferase